MNKQLKTRGGQIVGRGIEWTDYTFNPIGGCFHACQWTMPDGSVANCYAEDVAQGVARAAYPQKFEHHYFRPELLDRPLRVKTPSRVFVGSMADVFGTWVPEADILQVLETCDKAHWHQFQFLTKNFPRVWKFMYDDAIPSNCWLGASMPPDFMFNKPLSPVQKERMLRQTLNNLSAFETDHVKWMSFEPLSWDVAPIVANYPSALKWAVIGAASNGKTLYPPEERHVRDLIDVLDAQGVAVFFKGNLRSLPWAAAHWREEFPGIHSEVAHV